LKEDHVIQHGLVVDGASLSLALREHEKLFMEVCKNCSAVLCCRMAPLQKAKTLYDSVYLTLYNICFTSLPILVYSLFEQLVHPDILQSKPGLYRDISKNSLLSFRTFLYWTLLGFSHAFVFFFGSYILMGEDTTLMGNGQLALETQFWTWMNHFVTWGSIAFYFIFSLFYGGIIWPFLHTQDMYFVFVQLLSSGSAWFAIIIIIITCLFPDVVKKVVYRHLCPTSTQKSQVIMGGAKAPTTKYLKILVVFFF
ncbi:hypothetical protein XENOCAPTIV_028583, partial [Xenoophorus captivus]